MGSEDPALSRAELNMYETSRKSFHFKEDLQKGHLLSEQDLVLRRPGTGLNYLALENILGRALKMDVLAGQILDKKCI